MSFHAFKLHLDLLKAIDDLGYQEPYPIQQQATPVALSGRDLIGCAQTGTGKTAAFALPILNKLHPMKQKRVRALILTPTRELAVQIDEVFRSLAAHTKIRSAAVYGGVAAPPQERALRHGAQIIVATPGRLLDHMNRGIGDFSTLQFLILDEADRMLDMGFLPDVKRIIARLPKQRQTMLFSATISDEVRRLGQQVLRDPVMIQVGRPATPTEGVSHSVYPVAQHLKTALLVTLLRKTEMESVLIFARTKARTDRLARQLNRQGFLAAAIHGDRTQNQRQAALNGFRSGRCPILVATDIAARGLDIAGISHVVNYDVPVTAVDYVHRIGRTARAEAIGAALTLVAPAEETYLAAIQKSTKVHIPRERLVEFDYQKARSGNNQKRPRGSKPTTNVRKRFHRSSEG